MKHAVFLVKSDIILDQISLFDLWINNFNTCQTIYNCFSQTQVCFLSPHRAHWQCMFLSFWFQFALLMVQAILVFSSESSLLRSWQRKTKVRLHWVLMLSSFITASIGLATIYFNKVGCYYVKSRQVQAFCNVSTCCWFIKSSTCRINYFMSI